MSGEPLLSVEAGQRALLLGNEAVVRGAIEAGVGLVTGYPGTPASEIGDTFHRLHNALGVAFEYSVNEKIALEVAFGASLTGLRTLTSMKHLGLSSAADPLSTMPYIGVVGGMVIVSAADPGCLTSPNEQDQRHLGRMLGLPTLDPASPDEARRMTSFAFELSEACALPVLLRITTRVCHTRAAVVLGERSGPRPKPTFRRDRGRFVPTPVNARRMRAVLEQRLQTACERMTSSPFNPCHTGEGRLGLIATGAPRSAVLDVLARLGMRLPVLELGTLHPLPHDLIIAFLRSVDEVLVVEELTPYLEDSLLAIAHHHHVPVAIHGKRDGRMPWPFELPPAEVEARVRDFLGLPPAPPTLPVALHIDIPARPPVLCSGCPHRTTFHAATAVFGERVVYVNDIGCYTLGSDPPFDAGDVLLAMGSSVPIASGIARATGERVVAFIGDSTFFHSGMPALLNAIERDDDLVVAILDNHVTAMTGLQPSPTTAGHRIADVVRALGARDVAVVDLEDLAGTLRAFERASEVRHLSVIVAEGPCIRVVERERPIVSPGPEVDPSRCRTCGMSDAGLFCGLEPDPRVQRRVAVQRGDAGPPEPTTSPCSLECPLGICIPAYVGAIAAGEPERAFAAVALRAALPSVCSHVCHRPCEAACVRADPIQVNALKRYVTERPRPAATPRPPPPGPRVAIVGAGPAGLAAARELVRRGYAPTLFDSHAEPGGMLRYAIPEHRLPRDVLKRDIDAVLAEGVAIEGGVRLGRDVTLSDLCQMGFAATLLALGAQQGSRLDIPGARWSGATDALTFLADSPALDGDRVVVLGGGDVAIDAARVAVRSGAGPVTLVFPEAEEQMAAAPDTVALARAEGIHLLAGRTALGIAPSADGASASVRLGCVEGFARTAEGGVRFDSVTPEREIEASRIIFATGQCTDLAGMDVPSGLTGHAGLLAADAYGRTSVAGLFVAGDVATGPSTVTAAMAAGVRAAWAIDVSLTDVSPSGGHEVPGPSAPPPRPPLRRHVSELPAAPLSEAQARAEAERCRLCGLCGLCTACTDLLGCPAIVRDGATPDARAQILATECTACGVCVQLCPNRAIRVSS